MFHHQQTPMQAVSGILALVIGSLVTATCIKAVGWFKLRMSREWPRATARIESHTIQTFARPTAYWLSFTYSYTYNQMPYGGSFGTRLDTRSNAESLIASLSSLGFVVRVNPNKPHSSFVALLEDL